VRGKWYLQLSTLFLFSTAVGAFVLGSCMNRIDLFGTATTPEIAVYQGGAYLPNGGGTGDFGEVKVRDSRTLAFTVKNRGASNLDVTGISVGTAHPDQFSLGLGGTTSVVGPGGETAFSLTFAPARAGAVSATVRIESNDPDARLYRFDVAGNGKPASLIVAQGDTQLQNGTSAYTFDPVTAGHAGPPVEFSLENLGDQTVTVHSIDLGAGGADFRLSAPSMPRPLASGDSLTFSAAPRRSPCRRSTPPTSRSSGLR
jgi:hypothetical protein